MFRKQTRWGRNPTGMEGGRGRRTARSLRDGRGRSQWLSQAHLPRTRGSSEANMLSWAWRGISSKWLWGKGCRRLVRLGTPQIPQVGGASWER